MKKPDVIFLCHCGREQPCPVAEHHELPLQSDGNGGLRPIFPIRDMNNHPGPMGLSKRELFAAMAMQGFLSNPTNESPHLLTKACVKVADVLIAELEKAK